jgi:hypothetical protein
MKKLFVLSALALALAAGTLTALAVHPQPAMACVNGSSSC